ncbi:MAG: hypothetical protein O7A98_09385, partial [Acidobacteria bacterium]|nr:hypothetical protein [Acidobacteriota bacterium]
PLIAARRLRARPERTPWPLYVSRDDSEALVISGVGRASAAAASGWVQGALGPPAHAGWLNVGIAGHAEGPVGRLVLGHRIVEVATGRAWYPPPLPGVDLASETVFTVDTPELEYPEAGTYDMEASGFLAATDRWGSLELAQVVKIVSDTRDAPPSELDGERIRGLVESRMDEIGVVAGALTAVGEEVAERTAPPRGYEELSARWRFTATRRRQLRRLLERYWALAGPDGELGEIDAVDARQGLRVLTRRVDELSLES